MRQVIGNYIVEFPTYINGRLAKCSGFVTPKERAQSQWSQFFTCHDDGVIAYDEPERLPRYVKQGISRMLRTLSAA